MTRKLIKSILTTYEKQLSIIIDICESEIEKIFLLKIIDYIIKRPNQYSLSFIFEDIDTEFTDDGIEYAPSTVNIQLPGWFGRLSGIRISNLMTEQHYLEIFPQRKIQYLEFGEDINEINYRLDFGAYLYDGQTNNVINKICIECDGFDFHKEKHQIKRDNKRMRDLLFKENYTTIRYLGTDIVNLQDKDIGTLMYKISGNI